MGGATPASGTAASGSRQKKRTWVNPGASGGASGGAGGGAKGSKVGSATKARTALLPMSPGVSMAIKGLPENIDMGFGLTEKPWRKPEVDLSDYSQLRLQRGFGDVDERSSRRSGRRQPVRSASRAELRAGARRKDWHGWLGLKDGGKGWGEAAAGRALPTIRTGSGQHDARSGIGRAGGGTGSSSSTSSRQTTAQCQAGILGGGGRVDEDGARMQLSQAKSQGRPEAPEAQSRCRAR